MGRRLNISQPTVIKTELTPLQDMFEITASDTIRQWYYVNDGTFKPNRVSTPLILTPVVKAVDESTGVSYTPGLSSFAWYYLVPGNNSTVSGDDLWPGKSWVRITATADGEGVDWYVPTSGNPDHHIVVKKNVPVASSSSNGVTLCCSAQYADPRDNGSVYTVRQTVTLTTDQDATVLNPVIYMETPASQKFNIFTGNAVRTGEEWSAPYTLKAKIYDPSHEDVTEDYYIEWYATLNGSGAEVLLDTILPYTKATQDTGKGQGTDTVTVDMMFAEQLDIVCRIWDEERTNMYPSQAYASIVWDLPRMDCYTATQNGSAVDNVDRDMTFETIVNIKGDTLTDEQKSWHLQFHYLSRISTENIYTDRGWGQTATINSSALMQHTSKSTPVHSEVYLQGAYDVVTQSGEDITYDGEVIYDRT